MDRAEFLSALKRVSPALGRGDLLPQLAHLWFANGSVSAFDDNISISTPCAADFEGGVNGALLLAATDRSTTKELELKVTKQAVTFQFGSRINLKLGVMELDQRQFIMPAPEPKADLKVDRKVFNHALKFCLQSVGHDVTHPEWCGITFEVSGSSLHIYSGYSQVLVQATVPLKSKPKFKRVILHEKFCAQVLDYPDAAIELHDDRGMLHKEGIVQVFGRALTGTGGLDLAEMINVARERAKDPVPMPDLTRMLNRGLMFEGDHLNMQVSVVSLKGTKRIKMVSESGEGQLVDYSSAIDDAHPEIEVATNAKHLRSGASLSNIVIGPDEILMSGDEIADIIQVVSVAAG